jgi:murein DD-endopeptidase MepM/ murein hydrolase activator NlpD
MMLMIASLVNVALALAHPFHPEWGPEPPVAPFTRQRLNHQYVLEPMTFPIIGPSNWMNDFDEDRGKHRHTGIDIRAPKMTPIVAPITGVLGMKRDSFWIFAADGWAVLGTHLNDDNFGRHDHRGSRDLMFAPDLRPGQTIKQGQFIGYVGMSGDATAPHLHFELYAPGEGATMSRLRNPWPSLRSAQHLSSPNAMLPDPEEMPQPSELRVQGCIRKVDQAHRRLTLILTAKQTSKGHVTRVAHVRYLRLHAPDSVVEEAGGWDNLKNLDENVTLGCYVPLRERLDDAPVTRIRISPILQVSR